MAAVQPVRNVMVDLLEARRDSAKAEAKALEGVNPARVMDLRLKAEVFDEIAQMMRLSTISM